MFLSGKHQRQREIGSLAGCGRWSPFWNLCLPSPTQFTKSEAERILVFALASEASHVCNLKAATWALTTQRNAKVCIKKQACWKSNPKRTHWERHNANLFCTNNNSKRSLSAKDVGAHHKDMWQSEQDQFCLWRLVLFVVAVASWQRFIVSVQTIVIVVLVVFILNVLASMFRKW